MTTKPQTLNKEPGRRVSYQTPAKRFTCTSAQKNLFMQNKPNFPRFCAKNEDFAQKQTQFKPNSKPIKANQSQFKPNQTQSNPISNHSRAAVPQFLSAIALCRGGLILIFAL